jgi:AraC family transcriptional regulator, regulatory protein of adaptative response / methylated-DNA-[protein]-cysteine methyltransferase
MQMASVGAMDDGRRWEAVLARDRRMDGAFVFGVSSTGIYCRPSCPSRRPRRERVVFFPVPEAAETQGFRACLRCRPQDVVAADPAVGWARRLCREIEDAGNVRLEALARKAGVSPHHLQRTFKRVVGISPREYAEALRLRAVKARLKRGDAVTQALYEAGFGSSSRLYEHADARLGMTPATYGRGGRGMHIHYVIADSPLGRLLVGSTDRGVSAVYLHADDSVLEKALREEYPAAELVRDEARGPWVEAILAHLAGRRPHLELPVDVQATAFQFQVWEALRRIPYGETRTYAEVAQSLGRPSATRAVARACATNRVALVIPCHRVVGKGGALTGYRWGAERKRALLDREQGRRPKR